ncbi:hypothetical protein [Nannocystis punicea]|uniref:Uncharacterized protein n=1 Tax=Nannocystis punicea TaxID=2995304 RepID=A0ABY7H7C2_9BACT|nr:hypothetical protein [Nannocystis poenicansa]WAS94924.1 hypothetical protein O0S08_02080 [Nannocystis poenicansa]
MLAVASAALLLLAAPEQLHEAPVFLAPPLPNGVEFAARSDALREALVADPIPPGLALVDEPSAVEADRALRRGDLRAAAKFFYQHTEATPAGIAARFNAGLLEVGLGELRPGALLSAIGHEQVTSATAALFWDARQLLETDDARLQHARLYLLRYARVGGPDRRVLAEIEVGQILWRRACPVPAVDGTCGALARVEWPHGCYGVEREALLVVERDAALADEARQLLTAALRRARRIDRASLSLARARELRDATSTARWLLAESTFEALLRVRYPPGLRLEADEWRAHSDQPHDHAVLAEQRAARTESWRRLREFGDRKWALFTELEQRYAEILDDVSPATAFAALLRSSLAAQDIALQLSRVDAHPPGYEHSFCHQDGRPTDLREAGWKRLELCATLAVETGHVDAWAARCQQLFESVGPTQTADELSPPFARAEPRAFAVVLADP